MNYTLNKWPPAYKLRINKRAKRILLKISAKGGLQITIPKKADQNNALAFLNSKRSWVEKHLSNLSSHSFLEKLPDEINLLAINKSWHVKYDKTADKNKIKIISKINEVVIFGDVDKFSLCQKALREFIKKQAQDHLIPHLAKLSKEHNLLFHEAAVRSQQSRWGSCSRTKKINLNGKLLFLPADWVEYVLIHELCHTKHFDHSEKFWQLVSKFVPEHLQIRKAMRQANQFVPNWV